MAFFQAAEAAAVLSTAAAPAAFADGAKVPNLASEQGAVVTLYAKWKPNEYTIRFSPGVGGEGEMVDQVVTYDEEAQLAANAFSRANYLFSGWAAEESGDVLYADKALVKNLAADEGAVVTLYAQWQKDGYVVTFDANGGSVSQSSALIDKEARVGELPTPMKSGAEFLGWYSAKTGGYRISCEHLILANETYYARWSTSSTPSGSTYNIVFDVNGSAISIDSMNCSRDKVYKLPEVTITPTVLSGGKSLRFVGWWCEETGKRYDPGILFFNIVPAGSTATMTAVWE